MLFVSEGIARQHSGRRAHHGRASCSRRRRPRRRSNASCAAVAGVLQHVGSCMSRMRDIFTTAARGNTSIYTLDPRGLAPSEFGAADNVSQDADRRILNEAIDSLRIAGRPDRRPGDHRHEQPDARAEEDGERAERVLPARLHVDARAARRQVPRDPGARSIARTSTSTPARAIGPTRRTRSDARPRRPRPGRPRKWPRRSMSSPTSSSPTSRRTVAAWIGAVRGEAEQAQVTLVWEATRRLRRTRPPIASSRCTVTRDVGRRRGRVPGRRAARSRARSRRPAA